MTTYSLTVDLAPRWIEQYNRKGNTMGLCLAFGVTAKEGVKPDFNVVAACIPGGQNLLSNSVSFTWTENYKIAATQQSFQNGVKIKATTTPLVINYGQQYLLKQDWSGGSVNNNTDAPDNGFLFVIPKNTVATGLLYKPVSAGGSKTDMAPFYASANGPLPAGSETLIPIITAQVWFQSITESAIMWDGYSGDVMTVTYPITTRKTDMTVNFNDKGNWNNGPLVG